MTKLAAVPVALVAMLLAVACGSSPAAAPAEPGDAGDTSGTRAETQAPAVDSDREVGSESIASMLEGRQYHAMTTLADGRLLVVAGKGIAAQSSGYGSGHLDTAEVFDPASNEWLRTGQMGLFRELPAAVTLSDGRVLVTGGATLNRNSTAFTEIWDPATGKWTEVAPMNQAREKMPVVLLGDGRVLAIGGTDDEAQRTATAEVYDPATDTWTEVESMAEKRIWHTATVLPDGRVLVSGGGNPDGPFLSSAEIFDPETGTWSSAGEMNQSRSQHTATLMADGRVLVVGGRGKRQSSEVYDPEINAWHSLAQTAAPRAEHVAIALPDGGVLIAGGSGNIDSVEVYDPVQAAWTEVGTMRFSRYRFVAATLPDGRVALVGGQGKDKLLAESEAFTPPASGRSLDELLAAAESARQEASLAIASATPTPVPTPTPEKERRSTTGEDLEIEFPEAVASEASGRTQVPLSQPVKLALEEAVISPDPSTGATATFTEVVEDNRADGGTATVRVDIRMAFFEHGATDLVLDPDQPGLGLKKLGRIWVGVLDLEQDAAGNPIATVVIFVP